MVASKPNIDLLSDGGVEPPSRSIIIHQLWIIRWVAILLAVFMCCLVLVEKVLRLNTPNIDSTDLVVSFLSLSYQINL